MNEKMLLWFTTVVALAIGAGSVAKAADDPRFGIVERVQLDQAGGAQIEVTHSGPIDVSEVVSLADVVVGPREVGDFTTFVTFVRGGYVYHVLDPKGVSYRQSINVGDDLIDLSSLVGVIFENPLFVSAAEFEQKLANQARADQPKALPAGFGRLLASFMGVGAYSNTTNTGFDSGLYNEFGLKYQCVEYIVRFYSQVYGRNIRGSGGHARTYYTNASGHGLTRYANSSYVPPAVGNIVVSTYGTYGHVAIVTGVSLPTSTKTGYVDVIMQNWADQATKRLTLRYIAPEPNSFPKYKLDGFNASYTIAGWVK